MPKPKAKIPVVVTADNVHKVIKAQAERIKELQNMVYCILVEIKDFMPEMLQGFEPIHPDN